MDNYDSLSVAIEIQGERERAKQLVASLEAFGLAVKARADEHRAAMDSASGSDLDYLEGLVDGYEICYNQITEILNKESN